VGKIDITAKDSMHAIAMCKPRKRRFENVFTKEIPKQEKSGKLDSSNDQVTADLSKPDPESV
jgi:hypothetical protein